MNEINPDIVNIHLNCYVNYYFAFGSKKQKWDLVKTFHTIPGKDLNILTRCIERKLYSKKALSFIGISKQITEVAKALYPNCQITTSDNAIPLYKYQETKKEYDFIIVAALEQVKNHQLLFKAFSRLLNVKNYQRKTLLVVGEGSLKNELHSMVVSNKLEKNIILFGKTNKVIELLRLSKFFVLSSTREGNPISILEAMSQGLPIIAPKVGGIPDVIVNQENGFLFEVGNEEELFLQMKKACDLNDNQLSSISKRNIEHSKKYDITYSANAYFSFFSLLIKTRK